MTTKIQLASKNSKYTPRMIGKLRSYIKQCIDEDRTPFAEEFAASIGVSYRTVLRWAEAHKDKGDDFNEMYEILMTVQRLDIKKKSLSGTYENPIAKLILSGEHNIVEKVRKEVTGADGKPVEVEQTLSPEQLKEVNDGILKVYEKLYSKPKPNEQ